MDKHRDQVQPEAPELSKEKLLFDSFSTQEITAAMKSCQRWKLAIVLSIFCGIIGTIWQMLTCYQLLKARKTLRTPILAVLLTLVWPCLDLAESALRWGQWDIPLEISGWAGIGSILLSFFVTQAIFVQWASLRKDAELERLIRNWERYAMLWQFPIIAMISWIFILAYVEGWQAGEFDYHAVTKQDVIGLAGVIILLWFFWVASTYYQYKTVDRLGNSHWKVLFLRRQRQLKEKRLAHRAQRNAPKPAEVQYIDEISE